jgi:molybdenum cofactor cytidylyltransferase
MSARPRFGAIVLAAGASTRFGGGKILAPLDGRPLLEHVLTAVRAAGIDRTVVVLGTDAEEIGAAIEWADERRVVNPTPEAGLSSSLRVGMSAVEAIEQGDRLGPEGGEGLDRGLDGVFIILGDQPLVDPAVLRALARAEVHAGIAFVLPRYLSGDGANPVLILGAGRRWVAEASGDRGLGPIMAAHPELVAEVELGGGNPDVDTRADLVELGWADRVRRDRLQVDRYREVPDGEDFYRPVSGLFRADPRRTDEPLLDALLALARPDDVWLDIGAGAGRYAMPVALRVREVVALEPSEGMRAALGEMAAEHGIANVRLVADRWPPEPGGPGDGIHADVALIAHLGYDVEAIGPFLDAMETAADRLCVAILMERQPSSIADPFWPPIHGEARVALPALPEFLDLLRTRGREPSVLRFPRPPRTVDSLEELQAFVRRHLWLTPGGANDRRLEELVRAAAERPEGRWALPQPTIDIGLVSWSPAGHG